jgi:hypothetical protein
VNSCRDEGSSGRARNQLSMTPRSDALVRSPVWSDDAKSDGGPTHTRDVPDNSYHLILSARASRRIEECGLRSKKQEVGSPVVNADGMMLIYPVPNTIDAFECRV